MTTFVGIDIASQKFDVSVLDEKKHSRHKIFPNSLQGFQAFADWSHSYETVHVCMEATGAYSTPLATFLYESGIPVSVENLARIHALHKVSLYAIRQTKQCKNDCPLLSSLSTTIMGTRTTLYSPITGTDDKTG